MDMQREADGIPRLGGESLVDAEPGPITGTSLAPDLPSMDLAALQRDVIEHVESVVSLVRQALELLPGGDDAESEALTSDAGILENRILGSVRRLELRLPVVATMKAGKSTLINAIAGFRLLPYRHLPMTMLPTEVVLTARVTEPRLLLSQGVSEMLQGIVSNLPKKVLDSPEVEELAEADSYFEQTVHAIRRGNAVPPGEVHGIDEINSALTRTNDLVRLGVRSGVLRDILSHLNEMPRIECPPPATIADVVGDGRAELVLVDTPGGNEAGMAMHLFPLINREMQAAGVIFLVLNFIDMRSQAQDELRRDIDAAIGELGSDKLYVVVNRWDDRRPEDMDADQVKALAAYEAGLPDSHSGNRVFLTSARRAFDFSSFQREWEELGDAAWDTPEGHNLGQAIFTDSWPKIKDHVPAAFLNSQPATVWENSGFELLLTRALAELQRQAAPIVLRSAVLRCEGITDRLREHLRLRIATAQASAASLTEQLEALDRDQKNVDNVRKQLEASSRETAALEREIAALFDARSKAVRSFLSRYLKGGLSSIDDSPGPLGSLFGGREPTDFFKRIAQVLKSGPNIHRFDTSESAQSFLEERRERFSAEVGYVSRELQAEIPRLVDRAERNVGRRLRSEAKPIVEAAQKRIADTFNVDLELPVPDFDNMIDDMALPHHDPDSRTVPRTATQRVTKRRWYVLWTFHITRDKTIKLPDATEYTVDFGQVAKEYLEAFDGWLGNVRDNVVTAAGRGLQGSLDSYFEELDQFLGRYKGSIQGGLDAARLDRGKHARLLESFDTIVSRADAVLADGRRLAAYAAQFAAGETRS
jgi:hypothetical protein